MPSPRVIVPILGQRKRRRGAAAGGGGDVDPISDVLAHYDAGELELANGAAVNSWPDVSGNELDLGNGVAPVFREEGLNGHPSVDFVPTDYLRSSDEALTGLLNDDAPATIFVVYHSDAVSNDAWVGGGKASTSGTFWVFRHEGVNSRAITFKKTGNAAGDENISQAGTADTTNPHIVAVRLNSSDDEIWLDGSVIASGTLNRDGLDCDLFAVGMVERSTNNISSEYDGDIAEIAIWDRYLSTAEMEAFFDDLTEKYGL